jgi:hypothetical protein
MSFNNLVRKFYVGVPAGGGGASPSTSRTPSITPSKSKTPSVTPSISVSLSIGVSISNTPSLTPSISRTPSVFVTPSVTPSLTPSISITPTITRTPTLSPTPSPSADCTSLNIFDQMQQAALQFMRTAIGYYKINLSETKRNIYGESLEKWYFEPILIKSTIEREADTLNSEMFGPDVTKNIKLTIPRIAWDNEFHGQIQGVNVLPEIGDIVFDRSTERYYEVHNIIIDYIPVASNINTGQSLSCPQAQLVTYNLECTQTRATRLNLLPYKLI